MNKWLLLLLSLIFHGSLHAQFNPLLNNYDVKFIKLELEVTNTSGWIEGSCTMHALVVDQPLDTLVVELIDTLTVDSIKINQQICIFTHQNDEILIVPNNSIDSGQMFSSQVFYHGLAISQPGVHGSDVGVINLSGITSTNSETYHSKMWWPCKQVIGDKADSMYVFLTTDSTNKAGSIGMLSHVEQLPSGKLRYEWKADFPVAYYLAFFTVSDYIEYSFYLHPSQTDDSIFLGMFLPDSNYFNTNLNKIDSIHGAMEMLAYYYGDYPFERYGYCIVTDNPHENIVRSKKIIKI
ncbi:MAG: hypothetical protein U5Q03_12845 [Bacteroidota bacterium]|nr:hypothetical protein [Bacteroidota bacterium]